MTLKREYNKEATNENQPYNVCILCLYNIPDIG